MGVFDGLNEVGLDGLNDADLYRQKKADSKPGNTEEPAHKEDIMDYLYRKDFACPVCDHSFSNYVVRKSKLRRLSTDSDMKAYYMTVDPNWYDIILCSHCGYAALYTFFQRVSDRQAAMIKEKIATRYIHKEYTIPYNLSDAAERYKIALYSAVIKGAKNGEKALLCLKTAWVYRDLKDAANEKIFMEKAVEGFKAAFSSEDFPIGPLDIYATQLIVADLSRRIGKYDEAMRWISELVVNRAIPRMVKDKALMIKDLIREEKSHGPSVGA
jgi:uncharacterized protein (DUF2225 family)